MFSGCTSLRSVNMDGWDVSSLSQVDGLFKDCGLLTEVKGFDTVLRTFQSSGRTIQGLDEFEQFGVAQGLVAKTGVGGFGAELVNDEGLASGSSNLGNAVVDNSFHVVAGPSGSNSPSPAKLSALRESDVEGHGSSRSAATQTTGANVVNSLASFPGLDVLADADLPEAAADSLEAAEQAALILTGVAACSATLAQSAYDSCRSSLADPEAVKSAIAALVTPENPYGPLVAGLGIVCAAALIGAFALKLG